MSDAIPANVRRQLAEPRRWVHLPVEVKVRELESRALLACCLAEAGFGVVIGQQSPLMRTLKRLPAGLYFDKCLTSGKEHRMDRRAAMGYLNVSNDEEGLAAEHAGVFHVRWRYARPAVERAAMILCWGELEADLLRTEYPDLADRIVVTGNPRADLWRRVTGELFGEQAEQITQQHGRFVLIPSNFGESITEPDSQAAKVAEQVLARGERVFGDLHDAYVAHWHAQMAHLHGRFKALCPAVEAMARRYPDTTFVLRPHPSDRAALWRELLGHLPNVRVIYEGPIAPWIIAAEAIVHCGCTTAIEAYFLDKPLISYAPRFNETFDDILANRMSQVVHGEDELLDAVGRALGGGHAPPTSSQEQMRHVLYWQDDSLAADRMIDAFGRLDWPAQPMRFRPRRLHKACRDWWRSSATVNAWRDRLGRRSTKEKWRTYSRQKFPVLSRDELQGLIDRYARIFGRFDGVTAVPLDHNLYAVIRTA